MPACRAAAGVALLALILGLRAPERAAAELRRERMIGPGVKHIVIRRDTGPCVAHVVEVDTSQPYIQLRTTLPMRPRIGALRLSAQAARLTAPGQYPIAGINGDYFIEERGQFQGLPIGAAVSQGEIVHSPYPRSALVVDRQGQARIEILKLRGSLVRADGSQYPIAAVNNPRGGDMLVFYTSRFGGATPAVPGSVEVTVAPEALPLRCGDYRAAIALRVNAGAGGTPIPASGYVIAGSGGAARFLKSVTPGDQLEFRIDFHPELRDDDEVIGGGPRLVRGSQVSVEDEARIVERTQGHRRLPRSAVGIRGHTAFLVTIDGRRRGFSAGMTLWELARFMKGLGCTDAMALDGGGSTTMWVRGAVNNRPSDGFERPIANGLLVFCSAPPGPPARLTLNPPALSLLAGATASVAIAAEDQYYNPVRVAPTEERWSVDPQLASVDAAGRLTAASVTVPEGANCVEGTAWVEAGTGRAPLALRIYAAPPRLQLTPAAARLRPGQAVRLTARALDENGRPLPCPPSLLRWDCPAALGSIDASGTFHAGQAAATAGWVTASVNGTTARVPVSIGMVTRTVADFEKGSAWAEEAYPAGARATTEVYEERAHSGGGCLRLRYHFTGCRGRRLACARARLPIGSALALRLALWGDGSGAAVNAKVLDARGRGYVLPLCKKINWRNGWREVSAAIPAAARAPLTLDCVYLAQDPADPTQAQAGAILIDDVRADYAPRPEEEKSAQGSSGTAATP